ncbi:unnamed protein product, partial [Phaeothamnion confervicola]
CAAAAEAGFLEGLQLLQAHDCPLDKRTCTWADRERHLEVLRSRTNGCLWDTKTCPGAAFIVSKKMLEGARTTGCPWDQEAMNAEAQKGHTELFQLSRSMAARGLQRLATALHTTKAVSRHSSGCIQRIAHGT